MTTSTTHLHLYKVDYDVLAPVDRHPIGPRHCVVQATDPQNAKVMVAIAYDRRPTEEAFRFRRIVLAGSV
jgi:hypothetical protein